MSDLTWGLSHEEMLAEGQKMLAEDVFAPYLQMITTIGDELGYTVRWALKPGLRIECFQHSVSLLMSVVLAERPKIGWQPPQWTLQLVDRTEALILPLGNAAPGYPRLGFFSRGKVHGWTRWEMPCSPLNVPAFLAMYESVDAATDGWMTHRLLESDYGEHARIFIDFQAREREHANAA